MIQPSILLGKTAVSLISSFFTKSAEELGKRTGGAAWDHTSKIVTFLKGKLTGESERPLIDLEKAPEDKLVQTQLATKITEVASTDPQFARDLSRLLVEASRSGVDAVFNTAISGDVKNLMNIGYVTNLTIE
jgi:hypothetical protein